MDSLAFNLWDSICRRINYQSDDGEFWYFPAETIAQHFGDCDDSTNLLTSLLRCAGFNAYTVVGTYRALGHAWTELGGEILESTYTSAHEVPDPQDYRPYVKFNDREVIEMWPGALGQLFALGRRNERLKLNLMADGLRQSGW